MKIQSKTNSMLAMCKLHDTWPSTPEYPNSCRSTAWFGKPRYFFEKMHYQWPYSTPLETGSREESWKTENLGFFKGSFMQMAGENVCIRIKMNNSRKNSWRHKTFCRDRSHMCPNLSHTPPDTSALPPWGRGVGVGAVCSYHTVNPEGRDNALRFFVSIIWYLRGEL